MQHLWRYIWGLWLLSCGYFIVYTFSTNFQFAVDQSRSLSMVHAIFALTLILGVFLIIARVIYKLFHH